MATTTRMPLYPISGVITNNPLASGSTVVTSPQFALLPAVFTPNYLPICLDPMQVIGAPEVVWISSHSASSFSATVVRAQEGTSARAHASNETWEYSGGSLAGLPVSPSTGAVSSPYVGLTEYIASNDSHEGVWTFDSASQWRLPWALPWGFQANASVTTGQTGIGNTMTDITGLTVSPTLVGNRWYKIIFQITFAQTVSAGQTVWRLLAGGTEIGNCAFSAAIGQFFDASLTIVTQSLAAGSTTIKVQATTSAGSLQTSVASTDPGQITVEDMGPSGAPT